MHRMLQQIGVSVLLSCAVAATAHPGHEYHVEGTISQVRAPHFEVEDKRGPTSFMLVPGTEIFLNDSRATASEITVGVRAVVDGVENDRGIVEAKKVKLSR